MKQGQKVYAITDNDTAAIVQELENIVANTENIVDTDNSSSTPLNAGVTFTGVAKDVILYNSLIVSCKTDQNGTLYVDFSTDGTNWDSTITFDSQANLNEVHGVTVSKKYARIRFTNTSASNQTFFRLQTLLGSQSQLTRPLNSLIHMDADSIVTTPLDLNLAIAEGLYQNRNVTIKDGITAQFNTNQVPQDFWTTLGAYTGFPATTAAAELVVAGADTGTVYYSYMATSTDTDYTFGSIAITGAATYPLGHNIYRCNFMYFIKNSTTAFNAGLMTIRHAATPANIFCTILAGYSQSYNAAYSVPTGSSIFIDRITANMKTSTAGFLDGYFWYRGNAESPRYRFPFEILSGSLYFDDIDYLIKIPEKTDIMPCILTSSANNLSAKISYRFIKTKN